MKDIFEQEAILDTAFKTLVSEGEYGAAFEKSIIKDRVQVKGVGISGDVYVGKFFSLLDGTVRVLAEFEYEGYGESSPGSIIIKIKNLETEEIQTVSAYTSGVVGNNTINLNARTKYEITINVGSETSFPVVYLYLFDLSFKIKTKPEKYIISEQA